MKTLGYHIIYFDVDTVGLASITTISRLDHPLRVFNKAVEPLVINQSSHS